MKCSRSPASDQLHGPFWPHRRHEAHGALAGLGKRYTAKCPRASQVVAGRRTGQRWRRAPGQANVGKMLPAIPDTGTASHTSPDRPSETKDLPPARFPCAAVEGARSLCKGHVPKHGRSPMVEFHHGVQRDSKRGHENVVWLVPVVGAAGHVRHDLEKRDLRCGVGWNGAAVLFGLGAGILHPALSTGRGSEK